MKPLERNNLFFLLVAVWTLCTTALAVICQYKCDYLSERITTLENSQSPIAQQVEHEVDSVSYYINQLERILQFTKMLDETQPTQKAVSTNNVSELNLYIQEGWKIHYLSTDNNMIKAILIR